MALSPISSRALRATAKTPSVSLVFCTQRSVGRCEKAPGSELRRQPIRAFDRAHQSVVFHACRARELGDGVRVTRAVLAQVECREMETKGCNLHQEAISKAASPRAGSISMVSP